MQEQDYGILPGLAEAIRKLPEEKLLEVWEYMKKEWPEIFKED